jgi:hypothetical protein
MKVRLVDQSVRFSRQENVTPQRQPQTVAYPLHTPNHGNFSFLSSSSEFLVLLFTQIDISLYLVLHTSSS